MDDSTSKKMTLFLILCGSITGVILLELSLQLFSFFIQYRHEEVEVSQNENQIRILTIGESTTDSYFADKGPDSAWPVLLEMLLRRVFPEKDFQVINKGVNGTSSTMIINRLPSYIEEWKPHLIISMMGINDRYSLEYLHKENFFDKIILVKISKWYLQTRKLVPLKTVTPNADIKGLEKLLDKHYSPKGPAVPAPIAQWIMKHPDLKWYAYREISFRFFFHWWKLPDPEQLKKIFPLISEAVRINPQDRPSVKYLLHAGAYHYIKETRDLLLYALESGLQPNDTIISTIFSYHPEENKKLYSLLQDMGYFTSTRTPLNILKNNYNKLFQITRASNVQLAVMNYPSTNLNIFKSLFVENIKYPTGTWPWLVYDEIPPIHLKPPFNEIIFLDNSNFPRDNKDGYYIDQFIKTEKGGFGHTSVKGHMKIAENVFKGLSNWLKKYQENTTAAKNHQELSVQP